MQSVPGRAASDIVSFAEELGAQDNATVIIVPLAGWGKISGPDKTRICGCTARIKPLAVNVNVACSGNGLGPYTINSIQKSTIDSP